MTTETAIIDIESDFMRSPEKVMRLERWVLHSLLV